MTEGRKAGATGVADAAFHKVFTFLLWTLGILLFSKAMINAYGQTVFLILLIMTIVACLRLKTWSSRGMAAIVMFVIAPAAVAYVWKNTSPLQIFVLFVVASTIAYLIREHRKGPQPAPLKTHGAERTPVFPKEME